MAFLYMAQIFLLSTATLVLSLDYKEYEVPCNVSTPSCECPPRVGEAKVDVCIFTLTINTYHTFTTYRIDPVSKKIALPHGGTAWYINETTGELMPNPPTRKICTQPSPPAPKCTEPHTVDGYSYRLHYTVNGQFPGPNLIVNQNQTVLINVLNELESESISIHWHGMHQVNTNWMDGVQHITQCGIDAGTSFTYIFQADPPGTHWYHSHSGTQRNTGIYGAFIVREDSNEQDRLSKTLGFDFLDLPDQHTMLFQDWQNDDPDDVLLVATSEGLAYHTGHELPDPSNFTVPRIPVTVDGTSLGPIIFWAGLINGKGRHESIPYSKTRLSIFSVSCESSYRFRLIGAQHLFGFIVSFDEHQFKVIAKDGALLEPITVDYIVVQPGERYDIILETKSATVNKKDYIIRAETLEADENNPVDLSGRHKAEGILHYTDGGSTEPASPEYASIAAESIPVYAKCTEKRLCTVLNCPFKSFSKFMNTTCVHLNQLKSLSDVSTPPSNSNPISIDQTIFLNFGPDGVRNSSSINARNNRLPSSPPAILDSNQLQKIAGSEFCSDLNNPKICSGSDRPSSTQDCICTNVRPIPSNASVMLVLSAVSQNWASYSVHLHGHYFRILDVQHGQYSSDGMLIAANENITCDEYQHCTQPRWRNGVNPSYSIRHVSEAPLADMITVPAGGYVVLYLVANNSGYWYLHCVSEVHHIQGMGVILAVDEERRPTPPEGIRMCGNFIWSYEEYVDTLLGRSTSNKDSNNNKTVADSQCQISTRDYVVIGILSAIAVGLIVSIIVTLVLIAKKCVSGDWVYRRIKDDTAALQGIKNENDDGLSTDVKCEL